ncbi:L-dopachrome tautomerase-related protein [Lichenihabitans sp. Uapishka_5]|uniref:L-dopachrome tautomerase-related protein n=1 Tax=Lichenihabitans sp. Uapishka_5 TaxID=3037302 RepID=UPI0029E81047|nr:L-dopachrome tautomerase-related protein [Lichenihabitans sp. Uapishka_5]MDX7950164.1 L-dopachrome tautomerase-related protein [Lichenihabitans sp. Uapishka_5]
MITVRRLTLTSLVALSALASPANASDAKGALGAAVKKVAGTTGNATLERVAHFDHQVTGVAATENGRVFVNFPRWSEDAPISVAEIKDGKPVPYPDAEWNRYRNAAPLSPADHFVCVQAMTADGKGNLWVIDPAAPNTEFIVPGGPKLVKIDLKTNKVVQTFAFGTDVAPQGSYLNDVRFSPDGRWAYMTDSGATGALVVVDLTTGKGRRLLEGDVSTMPDKSVKVVVDGVTLQQPDGRGVQFAADSISIDPKGEFLYWQPLTGKVLYRIATATLQDAGLSPEAVKAKVEKAADSQPNDGLWTDSSGRIFFSNLHDSAITTLEPDGKKTTLVADPRLRWPDTFAEGPDATLYVTNSAINDSPRFNAKGWKSTSFNLWKIVPKDKNLVATNPAFGK